MVLKDKDDNPNVLSPELLIPLQLAETYQIHVFLTYISIS